MIAKILKLSCVPFVFFCAHAAVSYMHYTTCKSNVFAVFLFGNARSCVMMNNALMIMEKAMWCYAIAVVRELRVIMGTPPVLPKRKLAMAARVVPRNVSSDADAKI